MIVPVAERPARSLALQKVLPSILARLLPTSSPLTLLAAGSKDVPLLHPPQQPVPAPTAGLEVGEGASEQGSMG